MYVVGVYWAMAMYWVSTAVYRGSSDRCVCSWSPATHASVLIPTTYARPRAYKSCRHHQLLNTAVSLFGCLCFACCPFKCVMRLLVQLSTTNAVHPRNMCPAHVLAAQLTYQRCRYCSDLCTPVCCVIVCCCQDRNLRNPLAPRNTTSFDEAAFWEYNSLPRVTPELQNSSKPAPSPPTSCHAS